MDIIKKLAEEFKLKLEQVEKTVALIDEGNTIPFIARYRKEETGSLDDNVLRDLDDRLTYLRNIEKRKEEVTNLIYWRQLDATRNSIQMVGQANFSHNELQDKSCNMIQDMLMTQKGINWNDLPTHQKRGSCCIKVDAVEKTRPHWIIDTEIPIFKNEGREYIEKLIHFD